MVAGEIYIEITPLETGLRVAAVDPVTGAEVVFAAPTNCPRAQIDDLARAKLRRRLLKEGHVPPPPPADDVPPPPYPGPGRLV